MKTIILSIFILSSTFSFSQEEKEIPPIRNLRSFLLVGKIDKPADRYAIEVNLTRFFTQLNFKVLPSLNYSKVGNSSEILSSDSLAKILKEKGITKQLLISVRGYDKRFKPATNLPQTLKEALDRGHLFPLWQEQATSVTFEFTLYDKGKLAGYEIVKVGGISDRQSVFIKLQKRLDKVVRDWVSK